MIRIFKKCSRNLDNLNGVVEISDLDNYDKPFLLCLSSQDGIDKSVFGLISEGARSARIRTSEELAGGFDIDSVPFDFLGAKYELKNVKDKKCDSLLDSFIYPFLKRGNDIKKQARKINFFTYCNATNIYVELEKRLIEKLKKDGYSIEEINEIIKEIKVISIASEIDVSKLKATSISFKDVNDIDVFDRVSNIASKKLEKLNREAVIDKLGENAIIFAFSGTGEHSIKEYLIDGCIAKPALCACTSKIVDSSIKDKSLSVKDLLQTAFKYDGEFDKDNTYLDIIDKNVDYNGARRISIEEHNALCKLDKVCKKLYSTRKYLLAKEQELQRENNIIEEYDLDQNIKLKH